MSATPSIEVPPKSSGPPQPSQLMMLLRGVPGGILGALLGYFVFCWLVGQGFYGIMLIGAAAGLIAGLAAHGKSPALAVFCAVLTLVVSILAEWNQFPFNKDASLAYFLMHLHKVIPAHLIFIAFGVAAAYWFGQGR